MTTTDGGTHARAGWKRILDEGSRPGRILVVDDEHEVRNALARVLTRVGHSVQLAASAEEADQWLSAGRFDLCLLDIELPRMSGVEFLPWALLKDPEMSVIMLTGVDSSEVALRCIDAGARTFLVKPVELDFLTRAVRDALAMRHLLVEYNRLRA